MKHINPNQIDTFNEEIMDLDAAAAHIARISKTKRNRRVLLRWSNRGVSGLKLPTILIGGQIYTSKEKLNWSSMSLPKPSGFVEATKPR